MYTGMCDCIHFFPLNTFIHINMHIYRLICNFSSTILKKKKLKKPEREMGGIEIKGIAIE